MCAYIYIMYIHGICEHISGTYIERLKKTNRIIDTENLWLPV